jgi:hypothetical protein
VVFLSANQDEDTKLWAYELNQVGDIIDMASASGMIQFWDAMSSIEAFARVLQELEKNNFDVKLPFRPDDYPKSLASASSSTPSCREKSQKKSNNTSKKGTTTTPTTQEQGSGNENNNNNNDSNEKSDAAVESSYLPRDVLEGASYILSYSVYSAN